MKKQIVIWKLIQKSLRERLGVMLLYVLESSGSSPGRQGFFMAVNNNGEMQGSIGGGIMEYKFVEMAKAKLADQISELSIHKQIHNKSAPKNQSGMICSGEQTILLYSVKENDLVIIEKVISCIIENKPATMQLSPDGIAFNNPLPAKKFELNYTSDQKWIYTEQLGFKNQLNIIGGGHCAFALSKVMRMMDFHITVFDERKNLNTMRKNVFAHALKEIEDYTNLKNAITFLDNSYVVVMTFSYRTDDIVLRSIMKEKLNYLGVLGSKKKIEKMFLDYKNEGIPDEVLSKIHAPVGIQIKSQTPQEIAISIAAQIIKVKNEFY